MSQGLIPMWTVADRMRKARENAGLGVAEFAEEIGVSRRTVSRYESGLGKPPKSILLLWQMRTGVPVEWMLEEKYTPRDLNPEPTDSGALAAVIPIRMRRAA